MNRQSPIHRFRALALVALAVCITLANLFAASTSTASAADDPHWTYQTIVAKDQVGSYASLAFDSNHEQLWVSYYNATSHSLNLGWAPALTSCGGAMYWECFGVDTSADVGKYSSMAVNPHTFSDGIAYFDTTNNSLKYATNACINDCTWKPTTIDKSAGPIIGRGVSLTYDVQGNPAIAYYQAIPSALKYARYVGGNAGNCTDHNWQCDTIESGTALGQNPSLDLDVFGNAHIAYYDGYTGKLKYASQVSSGGSGCDGSTVASTWNCQVVDAPSGTDVGGFATLYQTKCSFGTCNSPTQIAYYDSTNHTLKYARHIGGTSTCSPGTALGWQCDTIETVGQWTSPALYLSMAVRNDGTPVIAYNDRDDGPANGRLKLASPTSVVGNCGPNGGLFHTWQCDTLDTGSTLVGYRDVGQYPSIIINKDGLISVAYYDATNADLKLASEQKDQTITFNMLPNKHTNDAPFTVSATTSSGLPIWFTSDGECSVNDTTVTLSGKPGTCTIKARQLGNITYGAAPMVTQTFAVTKQDQTISFNALPNKLTNDPPFQVTATASSGLPVSFMASGVCSVNSTSVTLNSQAGSCTITAHQAGDATYNPASDIARSFAVNDPAKQNQTISFAALSDKTMGDKPFTVSATASSGLPVSFTGSGACSVSGATVTLNGQGTCIVTAHQAGNATYNAAADVVRSFAINPPPKQSQTITFGALTDKLVGDAPLQVSATASSGLPVSFTANGPCSVNGAEVSLSGQAGNCTITALQGGDSTYAAAVPVARSFAINDPAKQNQTITFGQVPNKRDSDQPFTITATASSGLPVSFTADGSCSISGKLVTLAGAGSCTITAWQAGDATYNAAADVTQTFQISANDTPGTPGATKYTVYLPVVLR